MINWRIVNTIKGMKKQIIEGEKILVMYLSQKEFVSRIY